MSAPSATDQPARHTNGRFSPGNPGRRAGARGRVSHRAALAILFEHHRAEAPEVLRRSCTPAYFAVLTRMLDRELEVAAPAIDDYADAEIAHTVRLARPPRTALTVFNGETGAEPRQCRPGPLRTASTVINGETGLNHANAEPAPPRTASTVFNGETGAEPRERRSGDLRAPHLRCLTVRRGLRRRRAPLERRPQTPPSPSGRPLGEGFWRRALFASPEGPSRGGRIRFCLDHCLNSPCSSALRAIAPAGRSACHWSQSPPVPSGCRPGP